MNDTLADLRRAAREIFDDALAHMNACEAVRRAVSLEGERLRIVDTEFNLGSASPTVYAVATGKAARPMAAALAEILGDRLAGGVISSTAGADTENVLDSARWQEFAGGHPVPNEASLASARAAFELLRKAHERAALVLFLISGGGSAMLEWPRAQETTLDELRETHRVLVSCGAHIAEVNAVRRAVSAVKGGGLAAHAPRAAQVTLIVSDTGAGEAFNVASGLTLAPPARALDAAEVVARYNLATRLPASILRAINQSTRTDTSGTGATPATAASSHALRRCYVLLDNRLAVERAAGAARARGYAVEIAHDLVEQNVDAGASTLVSRLFERQGRVSAAAGGRGVCLVSGGEFACPVRGEGIGGRNAETMLRVAIEIDARAGEMKLQQSGIVALGAGTDGIDGNSPAAGALADSTTISRARARGLDPRKFLDNSDAYTFFDTLGDTITTGITGTNVRDLRILLARKEARG